MGRGPAASVPHRGERGAWFFGLVYLYELIRTSLWDTAREAVSIGLPIVLALGLIVGLFASGWRRLAFVLTPIAAAVVLGLWAYDSYQGGTCQYCLLEVADIRLAVSGDRNGTGCFGPGSMGGGRARDTPSCFWLRSGATIRPP